MKKRLISYLKKLKVFRNKYLLTFTIFTFYALFLDDEDVLKLISQNRKLSKLKQDKAIIDEELKKTRGTLKKLQYSSEIERYAREKKYFKKDNEDIFVISSE